ncbi:MAG: pleD 3 [Anaerosporomusa subterranea]|nr:pleD 3 [Anaerosporomusa subterranea]
MFYNFAPIILAILGTLVGLSGYYLNARLLWVLVSCVLAIVGLVTGRFIQKLSLSSHTDFLTGLWNRRYFYLRLDEEETRATRKKTPLCIAMIDVDGFKKINDTYGHAIGDVLLSDLAAIFKKNTRNTDIVTRWGGDEFAIIFVETSLADALEITERIRRKVEKTFHASYFLTISAGIIPLEPDQDIKDLLIKADQALYQAKTQKNWVITVDDMNNGVICRQTCSSDSF